jgi:D-serine deaminase-like pyridoxal phosphate-dependent protein
MTDASMDERSVFTNKGLATAGRSVVGLNALADDIATPLMIVRRSALEANIELLAAYCRRHDALLAPHAKTTMSPGIVDRQLRAGAWAITVASVSQAIALGSHAGARILIANEVVDPASIGWLNSTFGRSGPKVYCYVDSIEGARRLGSGITSGVLDVLLEIGVPNGRCGVRSEADARSVAAAIAAQSSLRLVGVAAFEGVIGIDRRDAQSEKAVRDFLSQTREIAGVLASEGAFRGAESVLLTAGGSAYFDIVVDELSRPIPGVKTKLVIRSGCYVTHDHGATARLTPFRAPDPTFRAAIEVLSSVLSRPEPGLAICDIGRRDVPFDAGLPVALWTKRRGSGAVKAANSIEFVRLNDQHGYLKLQDADLGVGDVISFGISHPCTAFDKWRVIPLVDDNLDIVELIHTVF